MASRHDPFEEMNRFFEQTRRMMVGGMGDRMPGSGGRGTWHWSGMDATLDVEETDDGYVIRADIPGFDAEDLTIRFEDGVLTIEGESETAEDVGEVSHRHSRRIHERLTFPATVLDEDASATFHNGVLEVSLPTEMDDAPDADVHEIDIE